MVVTTWLKYHFLQAWHYACQTGGWHIILTILVGGCVLTPTYIAGFSAYSVKTDYALLVGGVCLLATGVALMLGKRPNIGFKEFAFVISLVCGIEAVAIIGGNLRLFLFRAHFDNAAGEIACLCPSLPFAAYIAKWKNWVGIFGKVAVVLLIAAIFATGSRTGIISVAVTGWLFLFFHYRKNNYVCFGTVLLLPLAVGLYFLRPESADGRILIAKALLPALKGVPLLGYGPHGFRERYMDCQAGYFRHYPGDGYAMLADNTLFPFNEYLHFYFCFGLVGLVALVLLAYVFWRGYRRSKGEERHIVLASIASLCVLSLFSYPFNYPYPYAILAIGFYAIIRPLIRPIFTRRLRVGLSCALMLAGLYVAHSSYKQIHAVSLWRDAYAKKDMRGYAQVYERLNGNPYFLYNYASVLLDANQLDKSEEIALQCRQSMSSYKLELLLGEISQDKGEYGQAERHYSNASYMCPCRFVPLYMLMRLYGITGEKEKERAIASAILQKPIKVKSIDVSKIRVRARAVLEADEDG